MFKYFVVGSLSSLGTAIIMAIYYDKAVSKITDEYIRKNNELKELFNIIKNNSYLKRDDREALIKIQQFLISLKDTIV
jgi:hypothetical protein